jgi:inner membrane protein
MTWRTHVAIGFLLVMITFATNNYPLSWIVVLATFIGSLAPDLDASDAKIKHLHIRWGPGRRQKAPFVPLSLLSEACHALFGHRGVMHSLLAVIILLIAGSFIIILTATSPLWLLALVVGYISHLFADSLTPSGIPLLYPLLKPIHFLPWPLRIPTNSLKEVLILATCSLIIVSWLYIDPTLIGQLVE